MFAAVSTRSQQFLASREVYPAYP